MILSILTGIATIFIIALCIKLYRKIARFNEVRKALSKVGATKGHWFWGHWKEYEITDDMFDKEVKQMDVFPKLRHYWLGPIMGSVSCYWPSILDKVLNSGAPRSDPKCWPFRPWLGSGLSLAKGKSWERNRKMANPIFHTEMLKKYLKVFNESTLTLIKKWSNKDKIEVYDDINLFTFDALVECAMSIKPNSQSKGRSSYIDAIEQMLNIVVKRITNPLLSIDFIFSMTETGKEQVKVLKVLNGFTSEAVKKRRNDSSDSAQEDFLSILLNATDKNGKGLTDDEITYELNTFLFAGNDTPASALAWLMYNLAVNQEHQNKCREEAENLLDGREYVNWEDLSKLSYLTMCIKESLRLCPPAFGISRTLAEPLKFDEDLMDDQYNTSQTPKENSSQTFPAGTTMDIHIFNVHRNPNLWEDANKFDPHRFTKENESKIIPYSYIPFSGGPRDCIGQNFARSLIKVVMLRLLTQFKFSVDRDFPKPIMAPSIVLKSKNGIHLRLEKVQH